ncbi:MAG TPA: alanine racemase, partial [Bryobacteraceae bacterium]|nr:alanine racemase [Bryobacteraceae bacterium]
MASSPYRSWVEVSRGQIARNYRAIHAVVGRTVEVMPVVKADAYRHGAIEVARVLENEGARWLAVSNVEEGAALRDAGVKARILVMADFLPAGRMALLDYGLTPVLHSLDDVRELDALAQKQGTRVAYHLKVDSGMGRLGTCAGAPEIAVAVAGASHIDFEGLMTHFASVSDFTSTQTDEQVRCFDEILSGLAAAGLKPRYVHMASTGAIAYGRRHTWRDVVRPGHAIYGYTSPPRGEAGRNLLVVSPVMTWKAAVLTVKDVAEGALIGYGGMFRAPRPMRIAVLAVGYADGLPHRLSNRGRVVACGRLVPILGAVSMDVTTIDATDVPQLRPDDAVTLLGSEGSVSIDAQQIARLAGT